MTPGYASHLSSMQYMTACRTCHSFTSKKYARLHGGNCKRCATAKPVVAPEPVVEPKPTTPRGTGLKGLPVEEIIQRFWGDINRWPVENDDLNITQAQIRAEAKYISETGSCLWHAGWVISMSSYPCMCAACENARKAEEEPKRIAWMQRTR